MFSMSVRQFKFHINSFKRCKKQSSFARARRRQPSFENTGFTVTHIISDSLDKKPLVLKRRTAHCPHWNPSGREGQSNQAAVFHCERGRELRPTPGTLQSALGAKWGVSLLKGSLCPNHRPAGSLCLVIQVRLIFLMVHAAWCEGWKQIRHLQMIIVIRKWQRSNPFGQTC